MPLILLSNDDGFDAPYLEPTARAIERATGAEVVVVAPERERSAVSHSITLHKPLRVVERGERRFHVSGSPVDCVYLAMNAILSATPDLVVSGINNGYNLGADVFYSGTVGAAAEGALRGSAGLALSLAPRSPRALDRAAAFAGALANAMLEARFEAKTLLNVNIPPEPSDRYEWTVLGERVYHDVADDRRDPRGRRYYWIGGGVAAADNPPGTDCYAVERGHISVTPLFMDLTCPQLSQQPPGFHVDGFALTTERTS